MYDRGKLVAAARGDQPLDLLIQNGQLVNVLTGTYHEGMDVGILGQRIAFVVPTGRRWQAERIIDATGKWLVPGLIDGHVHNESSMVTPANWAKAILLRGTTTVFTDPHEIGNVLGLQGVRYMLDASDGLPLRYLVTAPSCVPAVPGLETAGAVITHSEMTAMCTWNRVVAVAEAMDYVGLIQQKNLITPISQVGHQFGVPIEGHSPTITGQPLQAYLAATGPRSSDHECRTGPEMVEKAQLGMAIHTRTSSFARNVDDIVWALGQVRDARMFCACTDDIMPNHLSAYGHLDRLVRGLIAAGVDPMTVYQMATINTAQHFGLWGVGAIAPSYLADILVMDNLGQANIQHVIVNGQWVVENGELFVEINEPISPLLKNTVRIPDLHLVNFQLRHPGQGSVLTHAIDMSQLFTSLTTIELQADEGILHLPQGAVMAAVVGRHGQGTPPSLVPMINYPLKQGAIASTVSHDSHNLCVIGVNASDMLVAVKVLAECGGGLVSVLNGKVLARAELPIAGLMSPLPIEQIGAQVAAWEASMPNLGLPIGFPMGLLSLALPVVPEVRLTDKGLVDVDAQEFLPVFP